jgi:hypothetical protein
MLKIRQVLTLQQSPKHLGLVTRFLRGHQVLDLMEGHHSLDPILWASILEDSKLSGVLGGWVIWIHEELQLDPFRLVRVRPIHLVHFLHLGNKRNGGKGRVLHTEGGKAAEDSKNLLKAIVWIEILQQKCDESSRIGSCIPILSKIKCNIFHII